MAKMNGKLGCMVVLCMIVLLLGASTKTASAAISCGQVTNSLLPCLGFIQNGGKPAPACCSGIQGLLSAAKTTGDRQSVCKCLKNAANQYSGAGLNFKNAEKLPGLCKVNIPYKLSTSTNCASIK